MAMVGMRTQELHTRRLGDTANSRPHACPPIILPISAADCTNFAPVNKKRKSPTHAVHGQKKCKVKPVIIHSVSPTLIHAESSKFMWVVQSLTGCALTRLRCEEFLSRENTASPTSTTSGTSSSLCRSTIRNTDDQHTEASADGPPHCLSHGDTSGFPAACCNENMGGARRGHDHEEISSSAALMAACYVGDQETSSTDLFINRHDEPGELPAEWGAGSSYLNKYLQETSSSACISCENSGSLSSQVERKGELLETKACSTDDDDDLIFLVDRTSQFSVHGDQDFNASIDSYLEHLLVFYDRSYPCTYSLSSSSAMLADVCDTFLLKEAV